MISANGGLPAHRYTPQVTPRWPRGFEPASPQGALLPRVYGTTTSLLWLELRGPATWQTTPSWTMYRFAYHRLLPGLWVTFATVPVAAWPGSDQRAWGTAPAAGTVGRLGRCQ